MIHKQDFLRQHPQFHSGVDLYSTDGEKLGEIIDLEEDCVVVSRGTFFAREFTARYDNLTEADADHAVLSLRRDELAPWSDDKYEGWNEYDRANRHEDSALGESHDRNLGASHDRNLNTARTADTSPRGRTAGTREEARIQLSEEELRAQKTARESEAHIRKVVHTEMRHLTVPVTREELVIERTPVREGQAAAPGSHAFDEEDMTVRLREEHAEVTKQPVVKEEVQVSKRAHTEQEKFSEQVRKEELKVDETRNHTNADNPNLRRH